MRSGETLTKSPLWGAFGDAGQAPERVAAGEETTDINRREEDTKAFN